MNTATLRDDNDDWTDLESPDDFNAQAPVGVDPETDPDVAAMTLGAPGNEQISQRFDEQCPKCRGSGNFVAYSGRVVGDCFRCKGTGLIVYRTSPGTRAKQRAARVSKVDRTKSARREAFGREHPELLAWLDSRAPSFDFAASLLAGLEKHGSLTPKQLAAAQRLQAQDAERAKQSANPSTSGLDLSGLPAGRYAVPDGETRLKLRINRPGKDSKWAGWIFVDDGAHYGNHQSYGSQKPGARYSGKCVEQLRAVLDDPRAAMAAYGKLTGSCGACGRPLEDPESIERGIGPVCAKKF